MFFDRNAGLNGEAAMEAGGDGPPIDLRGSAMVIAGDAAAPALEAMARGAGLRVLAGARPDQAAQRLERMIGCDVLLVDCRGMAAEGCDGLLWTVLGWPSVRDVRLLVLTDRRELDGCAARLPMPFEQLLCEPGHGDVALALIEAARRREARGRLSDIAAENEISRLEALSEEVRRLAMTIDRLAGGSALSSKDLEADRSEATLASANGAATRRDDRAAGTPVVSEKEVRALLHIRRMRDRYLPGDLFADPAWDMILDLMAARLSGKRVSVSSLCIASAVPPTTALRWLGNLTRRGLVERTSDPHDARRVFISLTDEMAEKLAAWFAAVRRQGLAFAGGM